MHPGTAGLQVGAFSDDQAQRRSVLSEAMDPESGAALPGVPAASDGPSMVQQVLKALLEKLKTLVAAIHPKQREAGSCRVGCWVQLRVSQTVLWVCGSAMLLRWEWKIASTSTPARKSGSNSTPCCLKAFRRS